MKVPVFKGVREDTGKLVEGYYLKLTGTENTLHIIVDEHGEYHRIAPESLEVPPDTCDLLRRIRAYYKTTISWDELFEDEVMEVINADY